jgi:hypothetical protein
MEISQRWTPTKAEAKLLVDMLTPCVSEDREDPLYRRADLDGVLGAADCVNLVTHSCNHAYPVD